MSWPEEEVVITSLAAGMAPRGKIARVELLGHAGPLMFRQDSAGLHVEFPGKKPGDYAYALKISGLKLR